jgi:uncharacterized membrane protein YeaQ/YmgE (transglycosylase-associated protein family)
MSGEALLIILIVGLIAGWLASIIVNGTGSGLIGDVCIGIVGALIGSWVLPRLGIHLGRGIRVGHLVHPGIVPATIAATIGAIVLLLLIRLMHARGMSR